MDTGGLNPQLPRRALHSQNGGTSHMLKSDLPLQDSSAHWWLPFTAQQFLSVAFLQCWGAGRKKPLSDTRDPAHSNLDQKCHLRKSKSWRI